MLVAGFTFLLSLALILLAVASVVQVWRAHAPQIAAALAFREPSAFPARAWVPARQRA
jgi:hypothetical protein